MTYYLRSPDELPQSRHSAVGAWFFSLRAENFDFLQEAFNFILDGQKRARNDIFIDDKEFITPTMKELELYKDQITRIRSGQVSLSSRISSLSTRFLSGPHYTMPTCR